MVSRKVYVALFISFSLFLNACSSGSNESSSSESMMKAEDSAVENNMNYESKSASNGQSKSIQKMENVSEQARMVIYEANLQIVVEEYETTQTKINELLTTYNGYLVRGNTYQHEQGRKSGEVMVRIPQRAFSTFLEEVKLLSKKVEQESILGQDVTEEYVDLTSRLKSKRAVEERLLSFMKEAEKVEDLLKISNDLSRVQEEIESVEGRMKYLKQKSEFSAVTISIMEQKVIIPNVENDMNTWQQTKKEWNESINALVRFLSTTFVFFVGKLPIFLVIGAIGAIVWAFIRKRKNTRNIANETTENEEK